MKHLFLLACLAIALIPATGFGADLYHVAIGSRQAADQLIASGAETVMRVSDGYLVLTDAAVAARLKRVGLSPKLLVTDIRREQLALDNSHDPAKTATFPILFEEGQVRLFQIAGPGQLQRADGSSLIPLPSTPIPVIYREPLEVNTAALSQVMDLHPIIDQVRQDSLQSYLSRLQSFAGRVAATAGNRAARDWIRSKLQGFGYAATLDPFWAYVYTDWFECNNVLAVKTGTVYPNRQVVIGAHFDAVPGSPGADDNGSGTAAVLEMARVLADEPSEMTIVFALFDSEEQGLNGSWMYASNAFSRGDSIICMVNMDMIASEGNTNNAAIKYGSETAYARLWIMLADTLVGLNGSMAGGASNSDHYPFTQNGYDVVYADEAYQSPYYHTSQDNTTHINFLYFSWMVKATLATAYAIDYAPLAVKDVSIRDGGDGQSLQVNWGNPNPSGVDSFRVYYDTQPAGGLDSVTVPVGNTAAMLTGLTNGQTYTIYVVAIDDDGHQSVVYNVVNAAPHIIPARPQDLLAQPAYRAIHLTWVNNNTELDFSHFQIIRDGAPLPQPITDTFYVDNDPSLGSDMHGYLVAAVDADGNFSDTVGVQPVSTRAATLQQGHILAVNRSGKPRADLVNETVTGDFMREALTGYDYDYRSDTAHGSTQASDTLHLIDLLDYEVVVFGGESARTDDFGLETLFGGFLDSITSYMSMGGKVVLFGRWGELFISGDIADTVFFTPGQPNYGYQSFFQMQHRVRYLSSFTSTTLNSDMIGAHSLVPEFPALVWDSIVSAAHSDPWTEVTGVPCPTYALLQSGPEVIYTYDSKNNHPFSEGRPVAWRHLGDDYQYIFFEMPLSFMQRASAVAALREAVNELAAAGWAAITSIDPGIVTLPNGPPDEITVYVGDFNNNMTAADVDMATMRINGAVSPTATAILPSHPPFVGDVLAVTIATDAFAATYGSVTGTQYRTYTASWQYTGESNSNLIEGGVTLVGTGYLAGDANGDAIVNVGDAVFIVNYIFKGGAAPEPLGSADANCDTTINVGDAVHIINYIFKGGPPPGCD